MYYARKFLVNTRNMCASIEYALRFYFNFRPDQAYQVANWLYRDYGGTRGDIPNSLEINCRDRWTIREIKQQLIHLTHMGSPAQACFASRLHKMILDAESQSKHLSQVDTRSLVNSLPF